MNNLKSFYALPTKTLYSNLVCYIDLQSNLNWIGHWGSNIYISFTDMLLKHLISILSATNTLPVAPIKFIAYNHLVRIKCCMKYCYQYTNLPRIIRLCCLLFWHDTRQFHPYPSAWWRHQMETISALLALCVGNSPVTGEFPAQRPVTQSFYVFSYLRLNKRLSKQSWDWWCETPPCSLWRHCNEAYSCGTVVVESIMKAWKTRGN